jgi:enediyne biosynthesis protein E4
MSAWQREGLGLVLLVALAHGAAPAVAQGCEQDRTVRFAEQADALGVRFHHQAHHSSMSYPLEVMGSGVALFDYDNDGRLDMFFANGASFPDPNPDKQQPRKAGPQDWNRLFHQKADGTFEDVTQRAGVAGEGYAMGVAVGDYDNDGLDDLFVAGFPHNHLYRNKGDGTFKDVTAEAGVAGEGWSTSAAWVDLDQDGLLDLVVLRYFVWNFDDRDCPTPDGKRSYCDPKIFPSIAPQVFHNDGRGHFIEVAQKIGMGKPGKGLGLDLADYNHDGKIDLFVANDGMDEFLYRNKGDGTFEETGIAANVATDDNGRNFAGMGVVFQDLNNDGWPDLVIGDLALQTFSLYLNRGDGSFDYASAASGLTRLTMAHSAWGMQTIDSDNRGMQDLVMVRGHVNEDIKKDNPQLDYIEPPMLLRNAGRVYRDSSACLGTIASEAFAGRGLAIGDLDNDGREDVVMTANEGRAYVLHNESDSAEHWITLQLVGTMSNRDGIGAEVSVTTAHGTQTKTVTTAGSYESSRDKRVHFGLGDDAALKEIEIRWPSGQRESIAPQQVDRFYTVTEGKGITASSCGNHPCLTLSGSPAGIHSGASKP